MSVPTNQLEAIWELAGDDLRITLSGEDADTQKALRASSPGDWLSLMQLNGRECLAQIVELGDEWVCIRRFGSFVQWSGRGEKLNG